MKRFGDVDVYEPCNYVSSVAYYRAAVRVCDYTGWKLSKEYMREVKRSFAHLAFASAIDHASHTELGTLMH